jgi:diacylglycerol O-acyltransferase / wax synthase
MDRLSPLDALFVDAEDQDPHTSMAIASIAAFEGPLLPMRSSWLS